MAYTIGPFDYAPNISASTYGYGETEEERKRREEEEARRRALAEPTPVTQTIKTDPVTGEQEMTIKGRPEDLSANNPYTPTVTAPIKPEQFMAQEQPPMPQLGPQIQAQPPVAPMSPEVVAQQMQPPAQPPAQPPKLPAMPQPGQPVQLAGPMVSGSVPQEQPQPPAAPQVAPNPLYAAPMAGGQTANGGPGFRMPGAPPQAPAISAVPGAGMTMPGAVSTGPTAIDQFYQIQDNPTDLLVYARRGDDAPEYLKERAYSRAVELMRMDVDKRNAQKQFDNMIANGDTLGIANAMKSKSEEGSWLKMLALGFISPQLAGEEAKKLGFGSKWEQTTIRLPDKTEKTVEIKTRGDGKLLEAVDLDGKPLSRAEFNLAAGAIGATGKTKPDVSLQDVEKDGKAGRVVTVYDKRNRPKTMVESGGDLYEYDTSWKPRSIGTAAAKMDYGVISDYRKKYGTDKLAAMDQARKDGVIKTPKDEAEFLEKWNFAGGIPGIGGPGGVNAPPAEPPAAAPAEPPAATPPAATTTAPSGPVPPSAITTPNVPAAGAGVSAGGPPVRGPNEPETIYKNRLADWERTRQSGINISETETKDRNKSNREYSDALASARQTAASQNATINRIQTSIDKNPAFWGIDTNSPAWRAFVDVNSTNENRAESLNTLARNLNIPQNKRSEFDAVMNDYRNLQVNAVTGSGLTASQTNTERESQRVMGTVGSISDRPAAAKAALEYAKAKIEYTDAKARAWAEARRKNPGIDRLDFENNFDATQGEQIFQRANERMSKILGNAGGAAAPTFSEGQTSISKSGKPIVYRNGRWEYQ